MQARIKVTRGGHVVIKRCDVKIPNAQTYLIDTETLQKSTLYFLLWIEGKGIETKEVTMI